MCRLLDPALALIAFTVAAWAMPVAAADVNAQAAVTCTLNFAEGATIRDTRHLLMSAEAASGVTHLTLMADDQSIPVTLTRVEGSTTPQAPATKLYGSAWLDTTAFPDGALRVVVSAWNGTVALGSLTRVLTVENHPVALPPPPPPPAPRPLARSFGFSGNGSAKLFDAASPTEVLDLASVTVFADVSATARLIAGTGAFCGTNRTNLTRAYPISATTSTVLLPPPAPAGQSVCLFFTPNFAGSALVQGDARGVGR